MRTVKAVGAVNATDQLVPLTIQRREVGEHDVQIEIDYAGICHSDIHTIRGDWGDIAYPQVVGHEIVGRVSAIGSAVTKTCFCQIGKIGYSSIIVFLCI